MFDNPLWSDSFASETWDYYDTEPIPFQDGSIPLVDARRVANDLILAKQSLPWQGSRRKGTTDQEEVRWETNEWEKRARKETYQGESSGTKPIENLRQNIHGRPMEDSKSEWEILVTKELHMWLNSLDFLDLICIIAKNSNKGGWDKKPHMTI